MTSLDYAVSCQPLSLPFFGQTAVRDFSVRSQTVSLPRLLPLPCPCGSCHTRSEEGRTSFLPLTSWLTASQVQEHLLFLKECPLCYRLQGVCTCRAISLRHFPPGIWMPRILTPPISLFRCYLPNEPFNLFPSSALLFFLALLTSRYCLIDCLLSPVHHP